MAGGPQSIPGVFGGALRERTDLAQKEFALFRTEMNQNIRSLFIGLAMIVGAGVFAIAALILFTKCLVDWLATVVSSESHATLSGGAVMAEVAIGLGLYGRHMMSSFS